MGVVIRGYVRPPVLHAGQVERIHRDMLSPVSVVEIRCVFGWRRDGIVLMSPAGYVRLQDRVLRRCRECVLGRKYIVTLHATDEMQADGYTVLDLERGILTGNILEVQRDRVTHERKYRIRGTTASGREIEQVVKLGPTGKLVIITVYRP